MKTQQRTNKKTLYIFISLSIYSLWLLLNTVLLVKSSTYEKESITILFPFNYRSDPGLWAYDLSEFICYSFVIPFLMYSYIKRHFLLANKLNNLKSWLFLFIIAYCDFVLLYLIVSDNYDVSFFLLSTIGGLVLFLLSMHITKTFISMLSCFNRKDK